MDASQVDIKRMAMDEFIARFNDAPFELIDGECVPVTPVLLGHGQTNRSLFRPLDAFVEEHNLGEVYYEVPYVLVYDSEWVTGSRVPDLMFIARIRWDVYKQADADYESKPVVLVPDLCVEIVSKNDSFDDVLGKVARYLDDGVRMIWVVDQKNKLVIVHRSGSNQSTTHRLGDTLSGEDVLPGFALPITDVFA